MITFLLVLNVVVIGAQIALRLSQSGQPADTTPGEAWEHGRQHGLREAHTIVAGYPKPWINFGEERGWDLARTQLTDELAHHLTPDPALPNETYCTAIQAPSRGVSQP